jgi:hypothetical protein
MSFANFVYNHKNSTGTFQEAIMSETGILWMVGGAALLVSIGIAVWLFSKSRKFNLTDTPDGQKPEWMRSLPPQETLDALKEDGEKIAVFDRDPGEKLAAPFAEQIEDIVRSRISNDPALKDTKIDFGTDKSGGLEIIVNGDSYAAIDKIPDEHLRTVIKQAVADYNKNK